MILWERGWEPPSNYKKKLRNPNSSHLLFIKLLGSLPRLKVRLSKVFIFWMLHDVSIIATEQILKTHLIHNFCFKYFCFRTFKWKNESTQVKGNHFRMNVKKYMLVFFLNYSKSWFFSILIRTFLQLCSHCGPSGTFWAV